MTAEKKQLVKEIEGTPFMLVSQENNFLVTCSRYKLYECADEDEAISWAKEITWDKIVTLIGIATEYNKTKTE